MSYRPLDSDPDPDSVRHVTFVPFLPSGECAVMPDAAGGLALPAGEVRDGEHWLLDTSLRVLLETAGFLRQRVGPFAADGEHLYAWIDGDRYAGGRRPHATVSLVTGEPERVAERFAAAGQATEARLVRDAARSLRNQSDEDYYAGNLRLLEPAYLRGTTPQQGSGFGGDAARWRVRRMMTRDRAVRGGPGAGAGGARPATTATVDRPDRGR